jgi:hypothetical protein
VEKEGNRCQPRDLGGALPCGAALRLPRLSQCYLQIRYQFSLNRLFDRSRAACER